MVQRSGSGSRSRLRALQRDERPVLPTGDHGAGHCTALFDYDNDGDLDVYFVQSGCLGAGAPLIPPPPGGLEDRLYRNDLEVRSDGSRELRFTDVSAMSGIRTRGTGWAWRQAISTTTATSISTSPQASEWLARAQRVHPDQRQLAELKAMLPP